MCPPAATAPIPSLLAALRVVPDPRHQRGRRYDQAAILTLAVAAMLSGARSLYAIAQWGRDHDGVAVRAALGLPLSRAPSVATLFRVFRDLDVAAFEQALADWLQAQGSAAGPIAIDGKTLRGIHGEQVPGVHLLAAYSHRDGDVLGQKGGASASTS